MIFAILSTVTEQAIFQAILHLVKNKKNYLYYLARQELGHNGNSKRLK